jgi:uncharacterized OB-fold protein
VTAGAKFYLPEGLPIPVPEPDGLSAPYWEGLRRGELLVQRCTACGGWQWGPEWICHHCHSFDLGWTPIEPRGRIYSWTRSYHPVHPALKEHPLYLIVVVELPHAGNIRMVGNLLGDPQQAVPVGDEVAGVFEHHPDAQPPFTLLQWQRTRAG